MRTVTWAGRLETIRTLIGIIFSPPEVQLKQIKSVSSTFWFTF